MISRSIQMK